MNAPKLFALALCFCPLAVQAQESSIEDPNALPVEYSSSYFEVFTPRSALDMILRIPGFELEQAEDRRGFGQGGANVLINGQRLTTKNSDISEQLSRIPAANVKQVEILDSNTANTPGLSGRVANVITVVNGVSGTWEWSSRFRNNLKPNFLEGSLAFSGETNALAYAVSFKNEILGRESQGPESRSLSSGLIFENADEKSVTTRNRPTLATSLAWTADSGSKSTLNLEIGSENFLTRENSSVISVSEMTDNRIVDFSQSNDNKFAEVTADHSWQLSRGKAKLTGLYKILDENILSLQTTNRPNIGISALRFNTLKKTQEAIIRAEYEWETSNKSRWQIAIEGALNALDTKSELSLNSGSGQFEDIPVENGDTLVEENRGEVTLTHTWPILSTLTLQSSIGTEYSKISQSGQISQSRNFVRPKGFISGTYQPSPSTQYRGRLVREVGQLNFGDFASSVNLETNLNQTANPDLVPAQTWRGELEYDKDFTGGNTLNVLVFAEKIEDLVDRIPIGIDGDAVGNIDTASRYGAEVNTTIRGDRFGWAGTELNLKLEIDDSSLDDPLTGTARRLNRDTKYRYGVDFRHDIPQTPLAYGVNIDGGRNAPIFRVTSIQQSVFKKPAVTAFIEHKNFYGLKINATVSNTIPIPLTQNVIFFEGRRDIGEISSIEFRNRKISPGVRLTLSGDF